MKCKNFSLMKTTLVVSKRLWRGQNWSYKRKISVPEKLSNFHTVQVIKNCNFREMELLQGTKPMSMYVLTKNMLARWRSNRQWPLACGSTPLKITTMCSLKILNLLATLPFWWTEWMICGPKIIYLTSNCGQKDVVFG